MPADARLLQVAQALCAARGLTLGPEVGAGAFKFTFRVTTSDGSARALKLYRRAGADARTQREVDAITRCSHVGVARFELIDTWSDGGEDFVWSLEEFLSGGTLTDRLKGGPLALGDLRALAIKLVDAVGHVASLGLVHRDLKPDNIMFRTAGGEPVIVDFGLVRDLQQTSLTKTWLDRGPGTPFYASPEQLNNEKSMIDWRSDQFALGVVLGMAGTGRHPFLMSGLTPSQIVDRVASRKPVGDEFRAFTVKANLPQLIQMTSPWPISRFRTPGLLADAWKVGGP